MNEVLGVDGWSFVVVEHGIHTEADEAWVLGELTATIDSTRVVRQQFGSQKIKRSRTSGAAIEIGFDLKGAATDALKKCAMLIGVGLYLSRKDAGHTRLATGSETDETLVCEECGHGLTATTFKDGASWPPEQLAEFGRRKHDRVLCMVHYRAANEARRQADRAVE